MSGGPLDALEGIRVIDLSEDLAGAYCTKLLSDAGAEVVKAESRGGHALRRWSSSFSVGVDGDPDSALFRYLAASHRSMIVEPDTAEGRDRLVRLVGASDITVLSRPLEGAARSIQSEDLLRLNPGMIVVRLSPFGQGGPRSDDETTPYLLQALSGGLHNHGDRDRLPCPVGGALAEWSVGVYAAVGALTALAARYRSGRGTVVDVSALECLAVTLLAYPSVQLGLPGGTRKRSTYNMIPGIHECQDGWVGIATITVEQWHHFLDAIGRADLAQDHSLDNQQARNRPDVLAAINDWAIGQKVQDVMELMTLFRVPVVPIGNGVTLPTFDHVVARDLYAPNPRGLFPHPRPPFRSSLTASKPISPSPALDEHSGLLSSLEVNGGAPASLAGTARDDLPLAGVRILDFTAFLAGPFATQYLASAGADVIKIESIQRPDPMRYSTLASPDTDRWYELGNIFLSVNLNKRGITLNLADDRGRDIALALAERADVVMENFTPRVMEQFRLTFDDFRAVNSDIIMVRMPGFGLEGPWRDRPGFAASMEQVSGMAWVTGYADGPPTIPGICDPVNGMHAVYAVLAALQRRRRTGEGQQVELAMLDMAANLVAEQVVEHAVYDHLMVRQGSRTADAAPQGAYPSNEPDQWVALSVRDDDRWGALCQAVGDPTLSLDDRLSTPSGRREFHDLIDKQLSEWFARRSVNDSLAILKAVGVPAERVVHAYEVDLDEQMNARSFWEEVDHPVGGRIRYPGWPLRFSTPISPWYRAPAPLLGQHNEEVLCGELGLSAQELLALRKANVVGDRPRACDRGMDADGRVIVDNLLTTTRTVRRRLDFSRPVSGALILECLNLALQAPTGGNYQGWRWIVIRDELTKHAIADCYKQALGAASGRPSELDDPGTSRMLQGAWHLADHLHEVPVLVIPCILGRLRPSSSSARAASLYGSIYPAVWSFQLALRSRGLGSAFTTIHLEREAEVARLLHVPERVTQAALIPVAHVLGDPFRPAERVPARQVTYWDTWDAGLEDSS